jgi:hypothetical protein
LFGFLVLLVGVFFVCRSFGWLSWLFGGLVGWVFVCWLVCLCVCVLVRVFPLVCLFVVCLFVSCWVVVWRLLVCGFVGFCSFVCWLVCLLLVCSCAVSWLLFVTYFWSRFFSSRVLPLSPCRVTIMASFSSSSSLSPPPQSPCWVAFLASFSASSPLPLSLSLFLSYGRRRIAAGHSPQFIKRFETQLRAPPTCGSPVRGPAPCHDKQRLWFLASSHGQ